MKKLFLFVFGILPLGLLAQQQTISQAIISTKTTIVSPEDDGDGNNPPNPPPGGDGERRFTMRLGEDGETKSTTYLKNGLVKTITNSETTNMSIIRDNKNKKTITLLEMMGSKTAIVATDEDQEQMRKQMDSMMQARRTDGNNAFSSTPPKLEVAYRDGEMKIAGYTCKKAVFITTRGNGTVDSSIVWYCPDFKMEGLSSTGGAGGGGFGMLLQRNNGPSGFEQLNGFPLQYERMMGRGRKMTVLVTKIETGKEIKDSEFEIPKNYEVKSAKDMQNGFGRGGFQMRIGS